LKKTCKKALALFLALALTMGLTLAVSAETEVEDAVEVPPFAEIYFFKTGDYDILYRVIPAQGKQIGRIFFIHGFVSSTYCWEDLAPLFSEAGYMCAMLDLPGFGFSTRESADVTPKDREAICAELMELLAPGERWIVAGHSMGGGVAVNVATMFPDKVSSLLLYAPGGVGGAVAGGTIMEALIEPLGNFLDALASVVLKSDFLPRLLFAMATADIAYARTYDISRVSNHLKRPGTMKSALYMLFRSKPVDFEAASKLDIPILLVWAEKEYVLTSGMANDMKAGLPQAVTMTIDAGHMFPEPRAQEVFEMSREFLSGINS